MGSKTITRSPKFTLILIQLQCPIKTGVPKEYGFNPIVIELVQVWSLAIPLILVLVLGTQHVVATNGSSYNYGFKDGFKDYQTSSTDSADLDFFVASNDDVHIAKSTQ